MQIKVICPAQKTNHHDRCQSKQKSSTRMTLQEYLESTNLKRRIQSRSKSKQNRNRNRQEGGNLLQPPSLPNQTAEYFKLNQEWKSRKVFSSWITRLKQMCRQFIKQDESYVQVIRLIQKMSEFVKNQIQTVKKDNLLLQSYLVTQASYWQAQGSAYDQQNNDKLTNYLKNILGKNQGFNSPCKSQIINEIENHSSNHQTNTKHLNNVRYKTASQPKKYKIEANKQQNQQNIQIPNKQGQKNSSLTSNNQSLSTNTQNSKQHITSTTTKQQYNMNSINHHISNGDHRIQKQQYIYSFKDKVSNGGNGSGGSGNYPNRKDVIVQDFDDHIGGGGGKQYLGVDQHEQMYQIGLLKINSNQDDDVPRLSLMSRFDENKIHETQKQQKQNNNNNNKRINSRCSIKVNNGQYNNQGVNNQQYNCYSRMNKCSKNQPQINLVNRATKYRDRQLSHRESSQFQQKNQVSTRSQIQNMSYDIGRQNSNRNIANSNNLNIIPCYKTKQNNISQQLPIKSTISKSRQLINIIPVHNNNNNKIPLRERKQRTISTNNNHIVMRVNDSHQNNQNIYNKPECYKKQSTNRDQNCFQMIMIQPNQRERQYINLAIDRKESVDNNSNNSNNSKQSLLNQKQSTTINFKEQTHYIYINQSPSSNPQHLKRSNNENNSCIISLQTPSTLKRISRQHKIDNTFQYQQQQQQNNYRQLLRREQSQYERYRIKINKDQQQQSHKHQQNYMKVHDNERVNIHKKNKFDQQYTSRLYSSRQNIMGRYQDYKLAKRSRDRDNR